MVTGLVAAAAAVVGSYFTFFNEGRQLDIEMVGISLSILNGEKGGVTRPTTQDGEDQYLMGRKFALRALAKYSKVDIPTDELEQWARSGRLAFGAYPTPGGSAFGTTNPADVDLTTIKFVRSTQNENQIDVFAVDRNTFVFGVVQSLVLDPSKDCFTDTDYSAGRTSNSLRLEFGEWVKAVCPGGALSQRPTTPSESAT